MATLVMAAYLSLNPMSGLMTMLLMAGAGMVDQKLFGKQTRIEGSRLADLTLQSAAYGVAINRVYGTVRCAGNVIWGTNFIEHKHTQGSGKGGGSVSSTSYTYTVSCAIGICEGPIAGIGRIWAGSEVYMKDFADVIRHIKIFIGEDADIPIEAGHLFGLRQ